MTDRQAQRDPRSVVASILVQAGFSHDKAEELVQEALDTHAHELAEKQREFPSPSYWDDYRAENIWISARDEMADLIDPKVSEMENMITSRDERIETYYHQSAWDLAERIVNLEDEITRDSTELRLLRGLLGQLRAIEWHGGMDDLRAEHDTDMAGAGEGG